MASGKFALARIVYKLRAFTNDEYRNINIPNAVTRTLITGNAIKQHLMTFQGLPLPEWITLTWWGGLLRQ
jgi:hypothetical protein